MGLLAAYAVPHPPLIVPAVGGGQEAAIAETTAAYGLSNLHGSIHGGPVSCVNCHAKDKEVTDNQCTKCHSWPHNPETGPGTAL